MLDEYDDILDTYALQYILGLSKNTVLKLLQNGTIPSKKVGKKYRILKSDLITYLHSSNKLQAFSHSYSPMKAYANWS